MSARDSASSRSRVTRASSSAKDELRRGLKTLRPLRFNALRLRALAGLLAGLEGFFIARTPALRT